MRLNPIHEIDSRRQKITSLKREVELLEAELRGMEIAAQWYDAQATLPIVRPLSMGAMHIAPVRSGGRQKGAISHPWRDILGWLWENRHSGFNVHDVMEASRLLTELTLKPSDIPARILAHTDSGLVESFSGKYRVTPLAAQKFGFKQILNEAKTNEAAGPSAKGEPTASETSLINEATDQPQQSS